MTAGHLIDNGNVNTITLNGKTVPVRLLARQYDLDNNNTIGPVDLALLFLAGHETGPTYQIAGESPKPGEAAWMVGFPSSRNGNFRETRGVIRNTRIVDVEYEFSKRARDGESGGPLFVQGFNVAGIVSTKSDLRYPNSTVVTTVPKIRRFVTSAIGGVPNCRKPKPTEPSPGIAGLLKRIEALERQIHELSKQKGPKGGTGERGPQGLVGVSGKKGSKGDPGPAGPKGASGAVGRDGTSGTVTVILIDRNGDEIGRAKGLKSGDVVRLKIKRFLEE